MKKGVEQVRNYSAALPLFNQDRYNTIAPTVASTVLAYTVRT